MYGVHTNPERNHPMEEIFIVAWTGGYEAPSYEAKSNEADAWNLANEYVEDLEDGDTLDVLRVNLRNFTIERLEGSV